jgi:hypothetical protein
MAKDTIKIRDNKTKKVCVVNNKKFSLIDKLKVKKINNKIFRTANPRK